MAAYNPMAKYGSDGKRKKGLTPADSTKGHPVLGPPRPGKNYNRIRDLQVASLPERPPKDPNGGPWRPDSKYRRFIGPTLEEAKEYQASLKRKSSRSSGSGGGGAPAATPSKPAKASKASKTPKTAASTPKPADPAAAAVTDDKMWADTFDPARRELQRQQDLLGQQKAASQSAWDSYNKWAEDKRKESAGLMTSSQSAAQTSFNNQRTASDRAIAGYIDAARGGTGAPAQGGDLAQATGSGAFAAQQAALGGVNQTQSDWQSAIDKVNNQRIADQQGIQQAMATQGSNDINASFAKASAALAAKRGELESSIGQAKLDKFYKDRQYGLDKDTLDWTKSLQGTQLAEQTRQFNVTTDLKNKQLSVQQQIAAGQLSFRQAQAAIDNQFKAGKLTVQQRNSQISAAKAGATSFNNTTKNALKVVGDTKKIQADFKDVDPNAQGEYMRQGAAALMAAGVPLSMAMKHMASMYGGRWSNFPAAVAETKKIFGGK